MSSINTGSAAHLRFNPVTALRHEASEACQYSSQCVGAGRRSPLGKFLIMHPGKMPCSQELALESEVVCKLWSGHLKRDATIV